MQKLFFSDSVEAVSYTHLEVNSKKVERIMQEVAGRSLEEDKQEEK